MAFTNFPNGVASFGIPLPGVMDLLTGGQVFWVDSNIGTDAAGRGNSPATAFKTIAYALTQVRSDKGDIILVREKHAEAISAAGGWALAAGAVGTKGAHDSVKIIGLGKGTQRPTITFGTSTAATITCSAVGVTFQNLYFDLTGIDAVAGAIVVTGADFNCIDCKVKQSGASNQATKAFLLGGSNAKFVRLEVDGTGGGGAASAIESSAAIANLQLYDCIIRGDYSVAPIVSASSNHITHMFGHGLHLHNTNGTAKKVMSVTTSTTGSVRWSSFKGTNWGTVADGFSASIAVNFFECYGIDDVVGSGLLAPAAGTIS